MANEGWRSKVVWVALFALVALIHLYFVPYFPALNNPNENARVYQVRALVELHKLSVNEQIARYGAVNDLAQRDGKLYSGKAPATTFLGAPVYAAARSLLKLLHRPELTPLQLLIVLRLATSTLPTLMFLVAFRTYTRRTIGDPHVSNALTILLALGTMMLPYALLYVNHSTSAACAFGAVIATEASMGRRRQGLTTIGSGAWLAVAGFLAAFAVALDYALAPVAAASMIVIVWWARPRWAELMALLAGGFVPAAATAAYHQVCWGGPFRVSMSFLANPEFAHNAEKGVFGIIGPTRESVWGVLFSPSKGLLFFSPFLAIGLLAVIASAISSRRSKPAVLSLSVVLWMLLYGVSLVNWDAGWTIGPRYVTVAMPFIVYAIGLWWLELKSAARGWLMAGVVGLGMASIVAMVGASVMFPHLQPGFTNPLRESIWPLWRDGITPHSAGRWLLGWHGRGDQAPVAGATLAIVTYLLFVVGRAWRDGRRSWGRAVAGAGIAVALCVAALSIMRIPQTKDPAVVREGTRFLRSFVWEPKIAPAPAPLPNRPPRR